MKVIIQNNLQYLSPIQLYNDLDLLHQTLYCITLQCNSFFLVVDYRLIIN